MATNPRDYDLAVYGAAGFVGRQTAGYLSLHAPTTLRWAMAGRNRARLEDVRAHLPGPSYPADILVADSNDARSVDAFVRRASVVLSTAGPFALYGTPVVDACVRFRTHYVDITGEIAWIRRIISAYHERAAAEGTRIIPCCGFDSVPSDLGTLLAVGEIAAAFGMPCAEVHAYFQMYGGFNGGTVASAIAARRAGTEADDLFALDPPSAAAPRQIERSRDLETATYDPYIRTWIGPYFMAPINTRVVRRSAALAAGWGAPYGDSFVYQEALKFDPPLAAVKAGMVTGSFGVFHRLFQWAPTRQVLATLLPKPGEGPSEQTMNRGWFTCELLGIAADGRQLRGAIRDQGDPGNRATAKFVCEAALAVCGSIEALPGGAARGGVLTPATGLGLVLRDRLRAAGVQIQVGAST